MKEITIKDIARESGLSTSTVSRALAHDLSNVSQATIDRVTRIAHQLGYKRNILAANLRSRKTRIIGIVIPKVMASFCQNFVNEAILQLRQSSYSAIVTISNEDIYQERQCLRELLSYHVDGILMDVCHQSANIPLYRMIVQEGTPMVFFDRSLDWELATQVTIDDYEKALLMVQKLIQSGRRRIVYLQGPDHIRNNAFRLRGYQDALEQAGVSLGPDYISYGGVTVDDGKQAMEDFLQRGIPFDALFCFTEISSIGAKSVLQSHGLRIPQDVALCSFSGTILSQLTYPTITTVEQPVQEMVEHACHALFRHIEQPTLPPVRLELKGRPVFRESTDFE